MIPSLPRNALTHLILVLPAVLLAAGPVLCQPQTPASAMTTVFEATIPELQQAMERGAITSVQLVDAYLSRIERYDRAGPALNAILLINPNARADAARLDAERAASGPRGPLHGIPIIVKDNYDVAGLPTTGGAAALAGHIAVADAFQIARLREAGAVILAKSNLHELAYGITTISSRGGQTLNPYDPTRNPGGSSGGTAAAIAASFAAIGWGSDTCGSIRIPAAVNNLFGLRPTKGLSSIMGIMPLSARQDVGGPLARQVTDLAIGLDASIGRDPADPATEALVGRNLPHFGTALDPGALQAARIGVLTQLFGDSPEEAETSRVVRGALERMRQLGAEVVEVEIQDLEAMLAGTSLIDLEFKWDLMEYLARTPDAPVRSLGDIIALNLHHPAVDAIFLRSDRHQTPDIEAIAATMEKRAILTDVLLRFLDNEGLDAIGYPSIRREAAVIGEPGLGNNCQLSAATGTPAMAIPAGFSSTGTPIGLELLGRPFDDARLVGFAYAYEQHFRPRRAPGSTPPSETDQPR